MLESFEYISNRKLNMWLRLRKAEKIDYVGIR